MNPLTSIVLSATTLPVLSVLALGHCWQRQTTAWGQLSEEIFRGDRLPVLPFPTPAIKENDS